MKKIGILLFATLFLGQTLYADDGFVTERMFGKKISETKSPYVKVIYKYKGGIFDDSIGQEDGILISKNHVMMGANSVCKYFGKISEFNVKAGNQTIEVQGYDLPDTFDCNAECPTDNILVLTLKDSVKTNKTLPIVNSAKKIKKGIAAQIAGFGRVNQNDYFGILKQSKTKITKKQNSFFFLAQYNGTYKYADAEGSPAVTIKVQNKKKKNVDAIAGLATCYVKGPKGGYQDKVLMLQNNKIKAFIKKATNNSASFM